jgi:hypothetical protein
VKRPGFFEGALVAATASLAGGACYAALTTLFPAAAVLRLLIASLALAYLVYLLRRSEERVGRISVLVLWLAAAAALWALHAPPLLYLSAHLGLLWLVRSLYFHSSLVAALTDLGLVALGLAAALWASSQTQSIALALWCFFLVQALYVAIPARIAGRGDGAALAEDRFQTAHRAAEAALRRLHSIR